MLRVQKYQDIKSHVVLDHNELWPLDSKMSPAWHTFFSYLRTRFGFLPL